ncbi:hypothetical protein B0I35DRAFT_481044 [Stachybotrys elegans]|uniref:FAD-binding PCMH-type domain-containing protein n=1 Tax=Stachybotrys elegans TaxID=80388 RepID=A0A8K0WNT7_9HYPO|nr:hypothetical protein B0I35DRAFT_481044 [Stachybotrys elegans]
MVLQTMWTFASWAGMLSFAAFVEAGPVADKRQAAKSCCVALEAAGLGERILYPGSASYQGRVDSFFSIDTRLTPYCFVQPETSSEVSQAVKALVADESCTFAVRSGGHTLWEGANNIEDGVTIDLGRMTTTRYHPEKGTATVSPGSRWVDVYAKLGEDGVAVKGGRTGTVGVGGLVIGGGMSFFSARKGFVCDTVEEFEVVLADGEIVIASRDSNAGLFKALKGGSSNFGIVTRYEMEAFEVGDMFGGLVLWNRTHTEEMIHAMVGFAENIEQDPYSTAFLMWWHDPVMFHETTILSGMHNTRGHVSSSLDRLLSVPQVANTTRLAPITSFNPELEIAPIRRRTLLRLTGRRIDNNDDEDGEDSEGDEDNDNAEDDDDNNDERGRRGKSSCCTSTKI